MATKKSTALPGVMAGSTVGTGTVKPQTSVKPTPVKKPVAKPATTPKPKTKHEAVVAVNETPAGSPGTAWVWTGSQW